MHVISSWTFSFTMALIWCSILLGNRLFTPFKATDLPHRWVYGDAPVPHMTSSDVFLTARNPNLNVHQDSSQSLESSTLAWKMPWTEEPGRLQSTKSLRIRHDWATSIWLFTFMHWRRKWQPIPVFLSRESQGWGSHPAPRVGYDWSDLTAAAAAHQQPLALHSHLRTIYKLSGIKDL